jgi:hypothetical protein
MVDIFSHSHRVALFALHVEIGDSHCAMLGLSVEAVLTLNHVLLLLQCC